MLKRRLKIVRVCFFFGNVVWCNCFTIFFYVDSPKIMRKAYGVTRADKMRYFAITRRKKTTSNRFSTVRQSQVVVCWPTQCSTQSRWFQFFILPRRVCRYNFNVNICQKFDLSRKSAAFAACQNRSLYFIFHTRLSIYIHYFYFEWFCHVLGYFFPPLISLCLIHVTHNSECSVLSFRWNHICRRKFKVH